VRRLTLPLLAAAIGLGVAGAGTGAAPARITVPAGFAVDVYARGLSRPTALAFGPGRALFAAQETGEIVRVRPRSRRPQVLARRLETPLGLAWRGRALYVSQRGSLVRFDLRRGALRNRRTVLAGLPHGLHQQNNVVVGPDGRLYLGSGSTCDACAESDPRSAGVLSLRPDGSDLRVHARGLRNAFGLAFQPGTRRLFVTVNNRDDLGTWEPAESVVVATRGADFGWPGCWPSWRQRRLRGSCAGVKRPLAYLEPHSSPDGLAFWRGALYVAQWGQYLSNRFGRRVVRVDPRTGRSRVFADGFDHPLAVAAEPGGGLLVADWGRGLVYRIRRR
jgi:glucose/arabinose dehydrogenase